MANLTANANVTGRLDGRTAELIIASSNTIYEGALVAVNASGLAIASPTDTANFRFMGVCIKGGVGDGSTVTCVVERRGTRVFPKASAAVSDTGKLAFVVAGDNNAVGLSVPLTNAKYCVGRIVAVDTTNNTVEVDLEDRVDA
jgi:hypothetical protein